MLNVRISAANAPLDLMCKTVDCS